MNFLENITFRRNRNRACSETTLNDSDVIPDTLESTVNSMPELSQDENEQLNILKAKLLDLESQLQSAHQEIELLSAENTQLRTTNEDLLKKNEVFRKISNSPAKQNLNTPTKKSKKQNLQTKQTQTEITNTTNTETRSAKPKTKASTSEINKNETSTVVQKSKMCILSTNNKSRILSTAEDLLLDTYDICHYITPGGSTEQLLNGIQTKLRDYTMKDYCIVLIGEEDFKITTNYDSKIRVIREILKQVSHTNIIICFPTYKLTNRNNLYNWRIETFNNLLYLDLINHEHAYYLDSNYDLAFDHTMFNLRTGVINNNGIRNIFENMLLLINYINSNFQQKCKLNSDSVIVEDSNSLFFRY